MVRQNKLNTPEKRARVGERIKVAATQAGLSLKELAEQAGISPSAIYQYVRGITAIPAPLLERIAGVTRVHTSFFDPAQDARQMLALPVDAPLTETGPAPVSSEPATRTRIETEYRQLKTLTDMAEAPQRRQTAYLSALEQMLALSRALGNREREASLLVRIGRARLASSDYAGAQSSFQEARDVAGPEDTQAYLQATLDLAQTRIEIGAHGAANELLQEAVSSPAAESWRAHFLLGRFHETSYDYPGALVHYARAAQAVLAQKSPRQEREAGRMLELALASLAYATGHYSAALTLWKQGARQAEQEREAALFVHALIGQAQTQQALGDLNAACQALKSAATLAEFLPEVESQLSQILACLAETQVALGALEEARENARVSLRIAHRNGHSRAAIRAGLAVAEARLASHQENEAREYAQEALEEARKANLAPETARAYTLCARIACAETEHHKTTTNGVSVQAVLNRAAAEARSALLAADQGCTVKERVAAQLLLAQILHRQSDLAEAERALNAVKESIEAGPTPLLPSPDTETAGLLALLPPQDETPSLFAPGGRVELPLLEWQAYLLQGSLAAARGDAETAYSAFRTAVHTLAPVLHALTRQQALAFQKQHPQVAALLESLRENARTPEAQAEAEALTERIMLMTAHTQAAVVMTATTPVS